MYLNFWQVTVRCIDLSSDENKLVLLHLNRIGRVELHVYKLPNLRSLFFLTAFRTGLSTFSFYDTTFSPNSSFFLYDSVKSCVCIAQQKEIPFIPHGPTVFPVAHFLRVHRNWLHSKA